MGRFYNLGWDHFQISISEAIECYTATAARATRVSQKCGKLEVGMEADLTVLDRDITSIPAEEICRAKAILTVVSGRIVHQKY